MGFATYQHKNLHKSSYGTTLLKILNSNLKQLNIKLYDIFKLFIANFTFCTVLGCKSQEILI